MADQNEIEQKRYAEYEAYRKNRERSESDFVEKLTDQLDISKQLNNSYKNVVEKLDRARDLQDKARVMQSRINSEIQKTKSQILALDQVILRNNSEIDDNKREMVANDNRLLQIDSARETLEKKRLLSDQELTISMYRREGLQWAISEKVREETEQISRSADLTARITENNAEQQKIQERMSRGFLIRENGEAEISRLQQQNIIFAGELMISQDAMNQSSIEKLSLQQRLNSELGVYENAYERSLKIENSMVDLQKEKNQLQERNGNLKSKEQNLNERNERADVKRNSLMEQRSSLQKSLVEWVSRETKAVEMITKLSAQLLFVKLIQIGYERFVKLDEVAEKFRRETGFSNTQMVEIRKNAESVNVELQEFGVGIAEAYASAKALTDVFGNTALVTKEAMTNVALMSANLNVAVEDSAAVLATFQGLGGATQEAAMNMMKIGAGLSEKAGVPFSLVMKDIANASDQTLSMLSANPSKLMKASIAARALGTDMNKLVSSQRKLLDYSTSMNEELELSALLGKSVSFQLSRQLAYEGDIAGAAKATLETVKAAGDFDKMSVYQREALAKASGMELKDLTKMMAVDKQKEEIRLRGTDEQKRQLAIQEETLKKLEEENDLSKQGLLADGERAIQQQKMQGLMTKMKNLMESITVIAGDILEPLITPMVGILIPLLKIVAGAVRLILYPFKALVETIKWASMGTLKLAMSFQPVKDVVEKIGNGFSWLSEQVSKLFGTTKEEGMSFEKGIGALAGAGALGWFFFGKGGFGKIMDMVKAPFKMVKDVGKNMLSKLTGKGAASDLIGPKLQDAAGDGVGKAAKSTKDVNSGTGVKDFLTNLAAGLKEMGNAKVLFGALNLIPASIGLIAMIPGFVGAKLMAQIDGDALKTGLDGLASGLKNMGTGGVAKGALVMMLASIGFAAMTIGAIGLGAVALLGTAAGAGLVGLSVGLAALGTVGGIGALVLMGISAAFIGFAYAGKLAAEAFISIAEVIPDAIGPLIKFALISPLLYATAGGIGALSLALGMFAGASVGGKLVSFFTGNPFDKFQKIADMSESLSMSAAAIKEISIAASSFTAVDEFAKSVGRLAESLGKLNDQLGKIKSEELSKLSQISSAVGTTSASTESKYNKVDNSGIEAKLDKLTDLLVGGAVRVYIDGRNVSSVIANV